MIEPLPSDIFRTGQILNNTYEIQGVIGRGGTGEVYRAVNQVTGRVFAIKALNAQFSGNSDYIELMKREEEIRSILHDAVVRYNECTRTDSGHIILVMDYIDGLSLAEAMTSRRIDPRELLIVGHRIAEGLVVAHAHGIVHRDLSPDNIILRDGRAERATLIDFGIAKDTAAGARTIVGNEFAGKYEYAAPEQLDGRADSQSDLYALGATLLAAYRGETPYLGTTPGEIVRRKQSVLDTAGVPEPLKTVIERLSAPRPEDRPADATATVRLLSDLLKPSGRTERGRTEGRKPGRPVWKLVAGLVVLAVLGGLGAAAYQFRDLFLGPSLPIISPFTLEAAKADGSAALAGYAADEPGAAALRSAFAAATGTSAEAAQLTLALGAPSETWGADVADLLGRLAPLESWRLSVSNLDARLSGVAPSAASQAEIEAALAAWDAASALSLRRELLTGPETLLADSVAAVLDAVENCGPLEVRGDGFRLGESVPIAGTVANQRDLDAIRQVVTPVIGSRSLTLNVGVLNPDLCTIRAVLPEMPDSNISVWLGNGSDGSRNLTGVYTTGQNPVAEVLIPSSQAEGYLWVMVVDNTGKVFHLVPNINATEQRLSQLGTVEGDIRRIRVLHAVADFQADPKKLAVTVNDGDYGKSEIIAILSRVPLFDLRRPRDESVASVAKALGETLEERRGDILAVASGVIESRQR